ncbi:MAG: DUF47 family protein [Burkholderiaceae bacterium]
MIEISPEARRGRRSLRSLARRLLPADRRLFALLDQQAVLVVDAADALVALLANLGDDQGRVRSIEEIEKRGDRVQREILAQIGNAWLPPFPRPLVHAFVNRMDDVIDLIEDAAQSLHLYHATRVTPEAIKLAALAADSARLLQAAVSGLAQPDARANVARLAFEVAELESCADHVMRAAMSRLFREEPDARQILKLKAIYEVLEGLTDQCKSAGNALQAIALRA